jgi:uncharacterized membrane protein (UPF0127 family)
VIRRAAALVVALSATSACGSHGPARAQPSTTTGVVRPEGFELTSATIVGADGARHTVCLWLATTAAQHDQGLMGVTDLGAASGMLFRFDEPVDDLFYMFRTPMPLSIAWFASDGTFVSSADMPPCTAGDADHCPQYGAKGSYAVAVEVPEGHLSALGIGPGSRLEQVPDETACA